MAQQTGEVGSGGAGGGGGGGAETWRGEVVREVGKGGWLFYVA